MGKLSQNEGQSAERQPPVFDYGEWLERLTRERSNTDRDLFARALALAQRAHAKQFRASGEPYVVHSLAVAEILTELRMDPQTIVAAILHDVVEDTTVSLAEVDREFGPTVARLVDGVTKMARLARSGEQAVSADTDVDADQAESLRKLLLAMADDVRVVLIKLADRLHNMRTLKYLAEERRRRIAQETLDIYAPLANRLGIWQIKWELEDLSFRFLEPETYTRLAGQLAERREDRENFVARVVEMLREDLEKSGIKAEVTGRPKHLYSIWRKMQRKGVELRHVFDQHGLRVLVDQVAACYGALGVVHSLWQPIHGEFDDYIATPKDNLYQSLHTAVIGPDGKPLEVQIRTYDMHSDAELGVAAHWRYKEDASHDPNFEQKILWLRQLLEWKEDEEDAGGFVDRFRTEVFQDRVYVLTPRGHVVDLPQGSTPLDFAYHIHTDIGHRCRGARVNGRIVPLTYELKSGEQVEILTTKQGAPSRDWLNPHLGYLKSARARAKVRHWFKQQDYQDNVASGRQVLERELQRLGVHELNFESLAQRLQFPKLEDFLSALGRGDVHTTQVAAAAQALVPGREWADRPLVAPGARARGSARDADAVKIDGVGNLLTQVAGCCHPLPSDSVIGYITRGRGVTIHRRDCSNILRMKSQDRSRLIEVDWSPGAGRSYPVEIQIIAFDRRGLLNDITGLLANEHINVVTLHTDTDKAEHMAHMTARIEIEDIGQLSRALERIQQLPNVIEVKRKT